MSDIGLTNDSATQRHIATKVYISSNRQMVKLQDLGNLLEPLLELLDLFIHFISLWFTFKKKGAYADLLEVVTQFDDGGRLEHALLVDYELAMLERVDVALDEQEIGAALYRQETLARNIDAVGVLEVLDGSTSGGLELDNCVAIVCGLGVDDDLELETFRFHDALEGWKYGLGHGSEYYIGPSSRIPFKLIHKLLVLKILNFRTRKGLNMKKRRKKTTVGAYQI